MATRIIDAMRLDDLEEVLAIEAQGHPKPWTEKIFKEELEREWARLMVLRSEGREGSKVVAFCNYWLVHDEVHLLNIATAREARRQGHGRDLLLHIIEVAKERSCRVVTLEVRESNVAAQTLYLSHGFQSVGVRPKYYADNREDAVVMLLELAAGESPGD